ncbi:MAG: glycosyltransferase [Cyanobacteria bacterium J06626_18]
METYILSQRGIFEGSAYGFIYEFEDLIAKLCGSQILVPKATDLTQWAHKQPQQVATLAKKTIARTVGPYQKIGSEHISASSPKVLFVICLNAAGLSMLSSIPNWRKQFDVVAAYVVDAWLFNAYPKETYQLDHLFVPVLEAIEGLEQKFKIPVSLLPFGANVLLHGSGQRDRPIDVMSFGRTPVEFHQALSQGLNRPGSDRVYYRHPAVDRQWYPQNDCYEGRVDHEYRLLFHQMMRRSKVVLAFDPLYDTDQLYESYKVNTRPWKFKHSVLSLRWIEGCAAGCAILGKRPKTVLADQILNWEDVTIELPENPDEWFRFTEKLLEDTSRLQAIHQRNYIESLSRHDWRYRIRDLFETLKLSLPTLLTDELELLAAKLNAQTAGVRS